MPPLSLLIKPASSLCNLRCEYCFYHASANQRQTACYGMMTPELTEQLVIKALAYADGVCTFAFQGGEPTLVGLDFYKALVALQKLHNKKGVRIHNALQTNGVLIDEAWAAFLAENRFLVGLSMDGPKEVHDALRKDGGGEGSHAAAMRAARLFDRYGAEYNILTVVSRASARHAAKVYGFFKKNGFRYQQYIPCLDPLGEAPFGYAHSLTPERYAQFLKTTFDLWYRDLMANDYVSIRGFDNYVRMAAGHPPESCGMAGVCAGYFVIESDGGVYPCDFYVLDEWRMGNVQDCSFDELARSDAAKRFVETSRHVDEACRGCRWFSLCRGGCRRNREPFADGRPVLNSLCPAYRAFFDHAGERIVSLADRLKNGTI